MWMTLALGLAHAGSGPWVPGTSVGNLYVGLDGEHFNTVRANGDAGAEAVPIGDGVGALGLTGILSYGLAPRVEMEARLPVRSAHVNRRDHPTCEAIGADGCRTTHTIGVIEARLKALVLDELSGQPLSLALGADVRFGGITSPTRDRITNAGEGTTDFGPRLAAGRSGTIGASYYTVSFDSSWYYRIPNTTSFPNFSGDRSVPGSEFVGSLEALFTPGGGVVTFGPYANGIYRPSGVDFQDLVVDDPDRFAALRIANVTAGGKLLIRDTRNHVFVVSVGRTVYAFNNPSDRIIVSFGVSLNDVFKIFDREGA
jgi:hypothetical protein